MSFGGEVMHVVKAGVVPIMHRARNTKEEEGSLMTPSSCVCLLCGDQQEQGFIKHSNTTWNCENRTYVYVAVLD